MWGEAREEVGEKMHNSWGRKMHTGDEIFLLLAHFLFFLFQNAQQSRQKGAHRWCQTHDHSVLVSFLLDQWRKVQAGDEMSLFFSLSTFPLDTFTKLAHFHSARLTQSIFSWHICKIGTFSLWQFSLSLLFTQPMQRSATPMLSTLSQLPSTFYHSVIFHSVK